MHILLAQHSVAQKHQHSQHFQLAFATLTPILNESRGVFPAFRMHVCKLHRASMWGHNFTTLHARHDAKEGIVVSNHIGISTTKLMRSSSLSYTSVNYINHVVLIVSRSCRDSRIPDDNQICCQHVLHANPVAHIRLSRGSLPLRMYTFSLSAALCVAILPTVEP
jgi:hypothetical protein